MFSDVRGESVAREAELRATKALVGAAEDPSVPLEPAPAAEGRDQPRVGRKGVGDAWASDRTGRSILERTHGRD
jgi:hypothetical protein